GARRPGWAGPGGGGGGPALGVPDRHADPPGGDGHRTRRRHDPRGRAGRVAGLLGQQGRNQVRRPGPFRHLPVPAGQSGGNPGATHGEPGVRRGAALLRRARLLPRPGQDRDRGADPAVPEPGTGPGAAAGVPRLGIPRAAPPRRAPVRPRAALLAPAPPPRPRTPAGGHTRVPSPRSDNWVLADCLARSTNVDAKPTTSSASASHGAQIVGLVTL